MIDSPALTGDDITPQELYAAARVCSSSFGPIPNLKGPKTWLQRFLLRVRFRRYGFAAQGEKFQSYLIDFEAGPQYWPDEGADKSTPQKCAEMDSVLELVSHVIRETGWPAETVWNLPIGQARWYSAAFLKLSGVDVPFWTPHDDAAYKAHLAKREAKLAGQARECAEKENIPLAEARAKVEKAYWSDVSLQKAKLKAMSKHA